MNAEVVLTWFGDYERTASQPGLMFLGGWNSSSCYCEVTSSLFLLGTWSNQVKPLHWIVKSLHVVDILCWFQHDWIFFFRPNLQLKEKEDGDVSFSPFPPTYSVFKSRTVRDTQRYLINHYIKRLPAAQLVQISTSYLHQYTEEMTWLKWVTVKQPHKQTTLASPSASAAS